jgi:hypothetical protein
MPEQDVDQPWWKDVGNALGKGGSFLKTAVASLDPRFIAEQGGKSVEHVTGDIYQLGRSVLTGEDTLSESPSARAYQAAGEGITGAFAAALPYVDVASLVYPFAKAATPAGALAIERAAGEAVASRNLAEGIANATPSATRPRAMSADMIEQTGPRLTTPAADNKPNISIKILPPENEFGDVRLAAIDNRTGFVVGSMLMENNDGQMVVRGLVSDSPIAMLKMLAAAKAKAQELSPDLPFPLQPDTSLSIHSRPLVERLQRAGFVDPNFPLPEFDDLNDITASDWAPSRFAIDAMFGGGKEIPPSAYQDVYDSVRRGLLQTRREAIAEGKGRLTTSMREITGDPLAVDRRLERINPELMQRTAELMPNGEEGVRWLVSSLNDEQYGIVAKTAVDMGKTDEVLQVVDALIGVGGVTEYEKDLLLNNILRIMRQTNPNAGRLP